MFHLSQRARTISPPHVSTSGRPEPLEPFFSHSASRDNAAKVGMTYHSFT